MDCKLVRQAWVPFSEGSWCFEEFLFGAWGGDRDIFWWMFETLEEFAMVTREEDLRDAGYFQFRQ